ncbi:unnamed protein product, partial [Ectocarpus sp. 6 AP-2014]
HIEHVSHHEQVAMDLIRSFILSATCKVDPVSTVAVPPCRRETFLVALFLACLGRRWTARRYDPQTRGRLGQPRRVGPESVMASRTAGQCATNVIREPQATQKSQPQ